MPLRQPIIATLGHVDHGKTTLLDRLRGTTVARGEAGGITQAIGTTEIPMDTIKKISGTLLEKFRFSLQIPGLLFIDTPGHEAFTTLRKRGGSISDLAVLVVDINEGIKPQTTESINILKSSKTPFVVAMTKIDKIEGWRSGGSFLENVERQSDEAKSRMEQRFYKVAEQFTTHNINVERFDRIHDYTRTVAGIPVSAFTGEGIPELLAILTGLSQQFLKDQLEVSGNARGNVMEVRELTGMGTTIDAIIYDGTIARGEYLVIGGSMSMITKIRSLLLPKPLRDIRTEKKFISVSMVHAASGVKIAAPGLDKVLAGSSIASAKTMEDAQKLLESLEREENVEIKSENEGLILRADTIGSLEALIVVFGKYPIKEAIVGNINKESIIKAESNTDAKFKIVLSFNVKPSEDTVEFAKGKGIAIMNSNIIYRLEEDYSKWSRKIMEDLRKSELEGVVRAGKLKILPGLVFRASNPAIVGCEVMGGIVKSGYPLMKDKVSAGRIRQLQEQGENVDEAKISEKVAVSIENITIGRGIKENDVLYTDITENDYRKLVKYSDLMTDNEKAVLEEISKIRRKEKPAWGL